MLVLKLSRRGKKHQPHYRLIVSERRSKLDGQYVDNLGWYNPRSKEYQFNKERVLHWLNHGAQKTDTVHNLLVRAGIVTGNKISVHKKAKVDQTAAKEKSMDENMNPQEQGMPGQGAPQEQPAAPEVPATPAPSPAPSEGGEQPTPTPAMPEEEKPAEQPASQPEAPAEGGSMPGDDTQQSV